jgi:hypothetical protein
MKKNNGSMKKPLIYRPDRPTMLGSRVVYGVTMWIIFALTCRNIYIFWPQITNITGVFFEKTPTFASLVAVGIAGYFLSLVIGIFGMFWRPGDKDGNPDTVDYSTEIPPSGAPAHDLMERGYITPDIANPFTFFYLYKKVVDIVVQPGNRIMRQERWMWVWIRGLKNIADVPRDPTPEEVTDMKRGGVYNFAADREEEEKQESSEVLAVSVRDLARSVDGLKATAQHLRKAILKNKE